MMFSTPHAPSFAVVALNQTDMMTSLRSLLQRSPFAASWPAVTTGRLIYVVDDQDGVGELYAIFLQANGYRVRTFTDRAAALTALTMDKAKPALLITDYFGLSMPIEHFIEKCRAIHPALRILMASGCHQPDVHLGRTLPGRFIQKPFTPDELQQEVQAALAA